MVSKGVQPFLKTTHCSDPINMYLYKISSKYLKGKTLLSAQAFHSKVDSWEITQKGSKGRGQPFLNVTYHLALIYMSTIYDQNISKGKKSY